MGQALPLEVRIGFARRFGEALRAQGYVSDDGSPQITRFATEHGFAVYNISRWLIGVIPRAHEILKLAEALKVRAGWLVFGEADQETGGDGGQLARRKSPRPRGPIRGGSDARLPQEGELEADKLLLIGRWLHARRWGWAFAHQPWDLTVARAA